MLAFKIGFIGVFISHISLTTAISWLTARGFGVPMGRTILLIGIGIVLASGLLALPTLSSLNACLGVEFPFPDTRCFTQEGT